MGNGPSSRRNNRISQNPGLPPPPRTIPPSGYPGGHHIPPPAPANYPPSGHHMPYYYPPNYNGAMPAPQYFQQGFIPTNGQYLMSVPPPQVYRPQPPPPTPPPARIPEVADHQTAFTIQNDVNLKKATLRLERDEANPGFHLVAFSFDATVPGRSEFSPLRSISSSSLAPLALSIGV